MENSTQDFSSLAKSNALKNTVKQEALSLGATGLISLTQLNSKLQGKQLNYNTNSTPQALRNENYSFSNTNTSSLIGSSPIVNLTFLPTTYINQFGQSQTTPQLDIYICTLDVGQTNTIVSTELINQEGAVKEIVSTSDFKVNITGVLIGAFLKPTPENPLAGKPTKDIKNLISICKSKIAVDVASDYLNQFGIKKLLCEAYSIPQENDYYNLQRFSITAVSDSDDIYIL